MNIPTPPPPGAAPSALIAQEMRQAALTWLESLEADQRPAARIDPPGTAAAEADRLRWFYTPTDHGGLPLRQQRTVQQQHAMRLVATGLSEPAYNAVATVMGMENILDRVEGWSRDWGRERGRDPELYWLRVFGDPAGGTWAWRFGGHHVSLNNLIVDGNLVAATPCFIGADPARAPLLGGGELAVLGATEDLARGLVRLLEPDQLRAAMLHERAPSDIISGNRPRVDDGAQTLHMDDPVLWGKEFAEQRLADLTVQIDQNAEAGSGYLPADHQRLAIGTPQGLAGRDMTAAQRGVFAELIAAYEGRGPAGWLARTGTESLGDVHFGWAGPTDLGAAHYYRVHGPRILVEYDNTQRDANHAHSVWRDPVADFGLDVLLRHRDRYHDLGR